MAMSKNNVYLASKPRYEILDGLRGVAAILVVAYHLLETYYGGKPDQPINHGYLAVDFFFVLSGEFLCTVEYDYPKFHLTMHCYLCSLLTEALHLNEHEAAKWLTKDELDSVKWLPADLEVIRRLKE